MSVEVTTTDGISVSVSQGGGTSVNVGSVTSNAVSVQTTSTPSLEVTSKGPKGDPGEKGDKGDDGAAGPGVAAGGATSTFLVKSSGDDYDTQWTNDLSSNSIVNTNTIISIGAITTAGNLSTNGQLTAGSITTAGGPIAAGNVTSTTTSASTLNITGAASQSIVHQGLLYDDFKLLSTGSIINVLDSNNDGINKQFIVADHTETPLMVVDENGNVGIGTTSPTDRLDVSGNLKLVNTQDYIKFANDLNTIKRDGVNAMRFDSYGGFKFYDTLNSTERVRIDSSGNVGIGTTTPEETLHITPSVLVGAKGFSTPVAGQLRVASPNASYGELGFTSQYDNFPAGLRSYGLSSNYNRDLRFYTKDSISSADGLERMRITEAGNVGIGTTAPESSLHIAGTTGITMGRNSAQNQVARVYADAADNLVLTAASGSGKSIRLNNYVFGNTIDWAFTNSTGNKLDFTFNPSGWGGSNAPSLASFNSSVGYSTGDWKMVKIENTLNQSGDAAFTDLFINRTENSTGTGNQLFIDAQTNSVSKFSVDSQGKVRPQSIRFDGTINNGVTFQRDSYGVKIVGDSVGTIGAFKGSANLISWSQPTAWGGVGVASTGRVGIKAHNGASTPFFVQDYGNNPLLYTTVGTGGLDGKVGIGTNSPSAKLDVAGLVNINDGSNNVLISSGNSTITASNTTAVGYQALTALTTGGDNTAIGYRASPSITTGLGNVSIGTEALRDTTTAQRNVAIGVSAGAGKNSNYNTLVGYQAGITSGADNNTAFGYLAGKYTSGGSNVSIGSEAAEGVSGASTFSNTVAVGHQALTALTTGIGNTAVGYQTLSSATTNQRNTAVGYQTLRNNTSGSDNTAIGFQSLIAVTSGNYNTAIGFAAGDTVTTGSNNTLVGHGAGSSLSNHSGNVMIGYNAGYNETASNKLYIENSNSTTPLIYGEFDNDIVRVNGTLEVTEGVTVDETGLAAAGDYGKGSEVWYQGTGATTAGSLYYLNSSGDWANTDASAASTARGMLAFAAGTDSDVDGMITRGFVYLGTDPGGSVGDQVFLSETANAATATAPSTSGAIVRVIGHKVATNVIYFNPSNDYFEVE